MTAKDNENNQEPHQTGLTPSQVRLLRIIVIFTSLFMILGFGGLVSVIVYKLSGTGSEQEPEQVVSKNVKTKSAPFVNIPATGSIKSVSFDRNRLAVHVDADGKSEILILDANSGDVINRIQFKNE